MPDMHESLIDHNANLPASYLPTADQVVVKLNGESLRVVRYTSFDEPIYFVHASLPETSRESNTLNIIIKRKYRQVGLFTSRGPYSLENTGKRGQGLQAIFQGHPYMCLHCDGLGYLCLAFDPLQPTPSGDHVYNSQDAGPRPDMQRRTNAQSATRH